MLKPRNSNKLLRNGSAYHSSTEDPSKAGSSNASNTRNSSPIPTSDLNFSSKVRRDRINAILKNNIISLK